MPSKLYYQSRTSLEVYLTMPSSRGYLVYQVPLFKRELTCLLAILLTRRSYFFTNFSSRKQVEMPEILRGKADPSNRNEQKNVVAEPKPEELFVPGTIYYLKKQIDDSRPGKKNGEICTLWRMQAGERVPRIMLSGNLIYDHKCDSHYHSLREVLKGLPLSDNGGHFQL